MAPLLTRPSEATYERIAVAPVTPVIGAEVTGVDLAHLDDDTWSEVARAFAEHQVLFFRDQHFEPEQQKALGARFGPLHVHPAAPTLDGHREVMVIHADERSKVVAGNGWHTDVSCDEQPPLATILWMTTVPPSGGDTLFASMYAAYDALSEPMRAFLDPLQAVHDGAHVYAGRYGSKEADSRDGTFPRSMHPVVRTHPVTGRKALYVNRSFTTHIKGLSRSESAAILDFLYTHMENPHYQCRFHWQAGSVAIWDNRCVQHYAMWDYYPNVRHGFRVSTIGERPR